MNVHVDNRHFWIGTDNGILFFTYKNGIVIDLPMAIQTVSSRLLIQNGKLFPVLCDVSGVRYLNRSAHTYLSRHGLLLVKALALVSSSRLATGITSFYMTTNAHAVPVRKFKSKDTALQFLGSL